MRKPWSFTKDDSRYVPVRPDDALMPWTLVVQSKVKGCYIAHQSNTEEVARRYHKIYCDFFNAGDIEYVHLYAPDGTVQDNPKSILG